MRTYIRVERASQPDTSKRAHTHACTGVYPALLPLQSELNAYAQSSKRAPCLIACSRAAIDCGVIGVGSARRAHTRTHAKADGDTQNTYHASDSPHTARQKRMHGRRYCCITLGIWMHAVVPRLVIACQEMSGMPRVFMWHRGRQRALYSMRVSIRIDKSTTL